MKADDATLDLLFNKARTRNGWTDKPLPEGMLEDIWNLTRMAPTSANCSPARIVFVTSDEAKEKLRPALMDGNVAKVMAAPATAIIGYDMEFYEHLTKLFPHTDARSWFAGDDELIQTTAFRNGTLQAAYFMLAARARGLGTAWTTLHLMHEKAIADLLGIPYDDFMQVALIPMAYTKGTDFKPAYRPPVETVMHVDAW